jgi:hypothetical protein
MPTNLAAENACEWCRHGVVDHGVFRSHAYGGPALRGDVQVCGGCDVCVPDRAAWLAKVADGDAQARDTFR